jgi:hypothetical protein
MSALDWGWSIEGVGDRLMLVSVTAPKLQALPLRRLFNEGKA